MILGTVAVPLLLLLHTKHVQFWHGMSAQHFLHQQISECDLRSAMMPSRTAADAAQHVTHLVGWRGAGGPKHSPEGGRSNHMPWDLPVPLHLKTSTTFQKHSSRNKATQHFSTGMIITHVILVILVHTCRCTKLLCTWQSHVVISCMLAKSPLAHHAITSLQVTPIRELAGDR